MPYDWPEDTDFALWELDVLDRDCPACGRMMHVCDHRYRRFHTLEGPVELVCKLNHCPDPRLPRARQDQEPRDSKSPSPCPSGPSAGTSSAGSVIAAVPATGRSPRSDPNSTTTTASSSPKTPSTRYIRRYQVMLAARQQDPEALRRHYAATAEIILSIDGLQPEKGHETLYVVRELTGKRVWFAEPLLSATADEVRRLIAKAKAVGRALGQAGGALVVGQAGRVRDGDRGGVPRRAASLLRQPLPPRRGQAGPGGRQPRQGPDAEEGPRPADDRTGRAGAAEGRDEGRPHAGRSGSHRHGDRGAGGPASCRGRSRRRRGARLLRGGARDPQRRPRGTAASSRRCGWPRR